MASSPLPPPKAILFDIGGVCVLSPFQAILDYEREHFIPTGYINSAIQRGPLDTGAWQMLERGEAVLGDEWFAAFRAQLEDKGAWRAFWEHGGGRKNETAPASIQTPIPPPTIDAKVLFWRMMRMARTPDPHIFPALRRLRASGRFVLGALSNTVAFPEGVVDDTGALFSNELEHHPDSDNTNNDLPTAPATPPTDIRAYFDVFISSAHVGVRKPDARAYEMAVRELDRVSRARGRGAVSAPDVLFLDDIGGNLKGARGVGLRTLRVGLGRSGEAVRELEGLTGVRLGGGEGEGEGRARL